MDNISLQIIDNLHLGIVILDKKQRILFWNRWLVNYTGKQKEMVLGQYLPHLYPLFQKEIYQDFFQQSLEKGQGIFCSSSLHPLFFPPSTLQKARQNMQIEYLSFHDADSILLQIFDVTSQEEKIQTLYLEIQERKRFQKELNESRERIREITQNMQDMVSRLGPDGSMVYLSPSYEKILGYSIEDLYGKPFYYYVYPGDSKMVKEKIDHMLKKGHSIRIEFRYQKAKGPYIWVESTGEVVKEENQIQGAILSTRDISKRKEMEEKLRENQEKLDSILGSLDDGVWSKEMPSEKLLFVNKALSSIYELKGDDLREDPSLLQKAIYKEDAMQVQKDIESLKEKLFCDLEYRIKPGDGPIKWIRDRRRMILNSEGNPIRMDGIITDNSASKEAQEELKIREDRFRTLVESVPEIILQLDILGRIVWTNDEGMHFFGKSYLEKNYQEFTLTQEEAQTIEEILRPLREGKEEMAQFTAFFLNNEDQERLLEWYGRVLQKENQVIGILFTVRDISDIRKTEASLKANTRLLEGVLNSISDVIAVQKPDFTIQRYNRAGYQLLGLTPSQIKGKKCYQLLGYESECQECATKAALKSKKLETIEKYIPSRGIYLHCRSNPILDEEGNVLLIVEQLQDVTNQKKLEEEIKKSEEHIRSIISLIPDLLVTFTPEGEHLEIWAKDWEHFIPKEDLLGNKIEDLFPENIAKELHQAISEAIKTRELQTLECTVSLKERIEFEARLLAKSDQEVLAIIRDITERKRQERALKEEMERARALQISLLPSKLPSIPKGSLAAHYQQASHVSGDYYDFRLTPQGLYLLMADVTGHGFDASLVTVFVSSFFRRELSQPQSSLTPSSLLSKLQKDFILQGFSDDYSLEVFVGLVHLERMSVEYAVAGAIRSILMDHLGAIKNLPDNHGMIINNVIHTPSFGQGEIFIKEGESLLIYTDGIDEPFLTQDKQGRSWIKDIGRRIGGLLSLEDLLERIVGDTLYTFKDSLVDDMSIVGLSSYQKDLEKKKFFCPRDLSSLASQIDEIVSSFSHLPLDSDLVSIALFEALSNAVDHGRDHNPIPIEAWWTSQQFCLTVSSGSGFDWRLTLQSLQDIHGFSERGRGLTIIKKATHRFTFSEKGDQIFMAWNLTS